MSKRNRILQVNERHSLKAYKNVETNKKQFSIGGECGVFVTRMYVCMYACVWSINGHYLAVECTRFWKICFQAYLFYDNVPLANSPIFTRICLPRYMYVCVCMYCLIKYLQILNGCPFVFMY